jgi:transcriptional regulator with XRE-family HTH domain
MMSKDLKTIGDRLKHLRKIEGMTQKDIADRTNIKRGNVSHYENNKIMPSAETIIELSKLFKVSTDWLLTGKGSTEEVAQEDNVSS